MASSSSSSPDPIQSLQEEVTCSICLEEFRDPVMVVGCGHNFCRACIAQFWEGATRNVGCPQCRATFPRAELQPNRQLQNVAQLSRQLSRQRRSPPGQQRRPPAAEAGAGEAGPGSPLCPEHRRPQKLFCPKEGALLCEACEGGHRDHPVVPVGKAARQQKDLIQNRLKCLKEQKALSEQSKEMSKKKIQAMQNLSLERQALVSEVERFRQFLKDQVEFLLPHLEVLQNDISKKEEDINGKLTGQINQLGDLICEVEKTCEQPGTKLLNEVKQLNAIMSKGENLCFDLKMEHQQEYETTYSYRHCTEQYLENSLGDLEHRFEQFLGISESVKEILPEFRAKMTALFKDMKNEALKPEEKACVTLDCDTANKFLTLSEDERSARFDIKPKKKLPPHPERFDKMPCVLGTEGFISGRFFWDVDVGKGKTWALGVARESVGRKRWVNFAPEDGIWAVGLDEHYVAYTGSESTPLNLSKPLKKIEVSLDYTAGVVSFYNVDGYSLIFTFPPAKFSGEKIFPWFWVSDGCISLCWSEEDNYPDMDFLVSTGIIKPWEIDEYM